MKVELVHFTPLWVGSDATRTCWASQGKSDTDYVHRCTKCKSTDITHNISDTNYSQCNSCYSMDIQYQKETGDADKSLIDRVGNKFKHASTLEHLYYNFQIEGVSRACLQEISRHRLTSPSVKSTRYTLKELKDEAEFNSFKVGEPDYLRASKYLVWTGNHDVDITVFFMLEDLRKLIVSGISNDIAKYALPEAYKTELAWSVNARSLQNFLALRSNKAALWEIRELAYNLYEALPEEHKFIFTDSLYKEKE